MDQAIEISPHSWHTKVRNWSYHVQGRTPPEQDNLCHYMQTVFLYAPLLALFRGYTRAQLVPIHWLLFLAGIVALISSLWQPTVVSENTLSTFLLGVFGYYLVVIYQTARIANRGRHPDQFLVWLFALCAAYFGVLAGTILVPASIKVYSEIPLWWVALVVAVSPLVAAAIAACFVLILAIFTILISALSWTIDRFSNRSRASSDTIHLVGSFFRAQKDRFCPTLRVPVDPKR